MSDVRSSLPYRVKKMAPCLARSPYRKEARGFVAEILKLPEGRDTWLLRTFLCHLFFHKGEAMLRSPENPLPSFRRLLISSARFLANSSSLLPERPLSMRYIPKFQSVALKTGAHYSRLFGEFSASDIVEARQLLKTRFRRNAVLASVLRGRALDAGSGGGRYTLALKHCGFESVVGLDISESMVRDARHRARMARVRGVKFIRGSVLSLPFPRASFDFVLSNGVLHHTTDWKKGIREIFRVLKPGGAGFLYLIERPGGIFWDQIELLRILMRGVPRDYAPKVFEMLGVPPNRRFYILDHIMVPINLRLRPKEIESQLRRAGAVEIRRLNRGTDFDRIEQIYRRVPHADLRYGVGENRYFFEKRK